MSIRGLTAVAVCLLFLGVVAYYAGWMSQSGNNSETPQSSSAENEHQNASRQKQELEPLLKDWKTPKIAFVFTGEQHGYMEPCGCSDTQSGGIGRRDDLFQKLKKKNWEVVALDLGGLSHEMRQDRVQSKLKLTTTLAALKDLEYFAVAFGVEALSFAS